MHSQRIHYSQCWEDPVLLEEALEIQPDDTILSITSGGDNTLALALHQPQKIVSVDSSAAQNYLLELKISAIQTLPHQEMLEFLGAERSSQREQLFQQVENTLSSNAALWWRSQKSFIERGVIHCGRFEAFLLFFRNSILPCVHSRKTAAAFLDTSSLEAQQRFYQSIWNSTKWRLLFRIMTSRFVLKQFARQDGMFSHTAPGDIATQYVKRLERHLHTVPLMDNYFMHYCLTGMYGRSLPPYLREQGADVLKKMFSRVSIVTDDLTNYLRSVPAESFSKYNLSDIFEALSLEQTEVLWEELIRTAKQGARIVYWNNLVPRAAPQRFSAHIQDETQQAQRLHLRDRVFFYGDFRVNTIIK